MDTTQEIPRMPRTPMEAPPTPDLEPSPLVSPEPQYEEPLYTEIRIPLPAAPKLKEPAVSPKSRPRAHTLSSLSPFHRRSSSAESHGRHSEDWPRIKKEIKNKEVAAMMNPTHRHKRSGTIDALAVVPTVLVLSAELFTPGEGDRNAKGKGHWEDGLR